MKPRYVLETERVGLRPMRGRDIDFLVSLLGDPEVMRFYPATLDRAGAVRWIQRQVERYSHDGHGLWIVVDKKTRAAVGQAGLIEQTLDDQAVTEASWMIAREHWRRGFATEAGRAALRHAFERLGRQRVVAFVRPENLPSVGVAEKLGMTRIGTTVRAELLHDVFAIDAQA